MVNHIFIIVILVEPGLWRPRWIMDRIFVDDDGHEEYRDRLYFKLNIDRTMKIYKSGGRPLLEIGNTKVASPRARSRPRKRGKGAVEKKQKGKPLFESDENDEEDLVTQRRKAQEASKVGNYVEDMDDIDGTWWWADAAPMNYAQVKLETRERSESGSMEKVRHEVLSDWGNLDSYAFNFRRGKIMKNRGGDENKTKGLGRGKAPIPLGSEMVGTFGIRVSPHRPMVSKDFLAFQ